MATKRSTVVKKLDRIFSEYIRRRDGEYPTCISCGKPGHWKDFDAGHYVNRSVYALRWSEKNVHAQCRKCNRFDEGNACGYTLGLKKRYGDGIIEELHKRRKEFNHKWSVHELLTMVEYYKRKLKDMLSGA